MEHVFCFLFFFFVSEREIESKLGASFHQLDDTTPFITSASVCKHEREKKKKYNIIISLQALQKL